MDQWEREDDTVYRVVVNAEEQYSIWPAHRDNPLGWRDGGKTGPKAECLEYINEVWTDMRPLSLRKKMAEASEEVIEDPVPDEPEGPTLVERLSEGRHPIEVTIRPSCTLEAFRECLERGYVHIRFTDTRGGTELGIQIDPDATDETRADVDAQSGYLHLEGDLTLDYVPVRCVADIHLPTFSGEGFLQLRDA